MSGKVTAVSKSAKHLLSKGAVQAIKLLRGLGVEGDAHMGKNVKHRSRVAKNPNQPNLRQVHLIHSELHEELSGAGFDIKAGQMGENITTRGLDLLDLPKGAQLHIGDEAIVEVTGLRNPCHQLNSIQDGLMKAVIDRDEDGNLVRKAGIMGIVLQGGTILVDDNIRVELPAPPHERLERV